MASPAARLSAPQLALALLAVFLLAAKPEARPVTQRRGLLNDQQPCPGVSLDSSGLDYNFYTCTCPQAQQIVADRVAFHEAQNTPGKVTAALLRLLFHDCFVRGCDASVLIDSAAGNTAEKGGFINFSLNPLGFDVVDDIKAALEAVCPQTVSCADILALGGREAVFQAGGPAFDMPLGRLDGTVSHADEANNQLPKFTMNTSQLIDNFAAKGLTQQDMVVLSGAHTLGSTHCVSLFNRLNPTDSTYPDDFKELIKTACNSGAIQNCVASGNFAGCLTAGIVSMVENNQSPGSHFSSNYYQRLTEGYGVFTSDVTLFRDARTQGLVQQFAQDQQGWFTAFSASLLDMARIGVQPAQRGARAREDCRVVSP